MVADKLRFFKDRAYCILLDPGTFFCGGIAGTVGRAAVLPLDSTGGAARCVYRKAPQFAMILWMYPHVRSSNPLYAAVAGASCGGLTQAIANPFNAVRDHAERQGVSNITALGQLRKKGALHLWVGQPPVLANALYWGVLFGTYQLFHPYFAEESKAMKGTEVLQAAIGGGVSAAVASSLTFSFSNSTYASTLSRPFIFQNGRFATLAKEVPMVAMVFGTFVMLQSVVNSGNKHGYGGGL